MILDQTLPTNCGISRRQYSRTLFRLMAGSNMGHTRALLYWYEYLYPKRRTTKYPSHCVPCNGNIPFKIYFRCVFVFNATEYDHSGVLCTVAHKKVLVLGTTCMYCTLIPFSTVLKTMVIYFKNDNVVQY